MRHIDLAAHFEHLGRVQKGLGNIWDAARIGGDVFAGIAVAARRGIDQCAVLVTNRQGQAVDLGFGCKCQGIGMAQKAADTAVKIDHIFGVKSVFQREHRHLMRDFAKTF